MNQIMISMIAVQKEHVNTQKGGYNVLNCTYKLKLGGQEKVEAKKIMSFAVSPESFKKLEESKMGDVFTIVREKNDKGYWDWKNVVEGEAIAAALAAEPAKAGNARSAFETPEERDFRQTMIVRQSCLAQAVNFIAGKEESVDTVLTVAEQFEQWVIRKE